MTIEIKATLSTLSTLYKSLSDALSSQEKRRARLFENFIEPLQTSVDAVQRRYLTDLAAYDSLLSTCPPPYSASHPLVVRVLQDARETIADRTTLNTHYDGLLYRVED